MILHPYIEVNDVNPNLDGTSYGHKIVQMFYRVSTAGCMPISNIANSSIFLSCQPWCSVQAVGIELVPIGKDEAFSARSRSIWNRLVGL